MKLKESQSDIYEAGIISVMLRSGIDAYLKVQQVFLPEAFSIIQYRDIAQAVRNCAENGTGIDILIIHSELLKMGKKVGMADLVAIRDDVRQRENVMNWILLINQKYLRLRLIEIAETAKRLSVNAPSDIFETLDSVTQQIYELQNLFAAENVRTSAESVDETIKHIEERQRNLAGGIISGCPSGIPSLDRETYGWQEPDYIVIAGNPGEGKTTLALQSAISTAEAGQPVLFISLEMTRQQLMLKQFSYYADIDGQRLRVGNVDERDWHHINYAAGRIEKLNNFFIDDSPNMKLGQIRVKCRKYKQLHGIKLVIIDYLQMIQGASKRNSHDEVKTISKGIKSLCKELKIPIIVISSLSKEAIKTADKRPHPGHLKESGDIWYDADAVLTVYRPEVHQVKKFYDAKDNEHNPEGLGVIDIWKQRMGSQAEVLTTFRGRQNKFVEYSGQVDHLQNANG